MEFESPLNRFSIDRACDYEGKEVKLLGWLHNKRSSGKIRFAIVRDGTGLMQCVFFKGDVDQESFDKIRDLPQESAVLLEGSIKKEPRSVGGYEMGVKKMTVLSEAEEGYPIQPKEHGVDFLLDHRHLWIRSKKQAALLRLRSKVTFSLRRFFEEHGFTLVDSPMFTPNACEGTSTLFEVGYFDQKAYLTQSGQLYGEASAMAFQKIVVFGPTFRAEKSKTRKHLTEFWMLEPEIAFCEMNQAMDVSEAMCKFVFKDMIENASSELEILERDPEKLKALSEKPFLRMSYDEAVKKLHDNGFKFEWGDDFGAPHETALGEGQESPVFITHFPEKIKGFYFKRDAEKDSTVLGFDLIAPDGYGEIIGGGQREDDTETLRKRIKEHDLSEEDFQWYLDLRRFGSVPHAGYGLGLERFLTWIAGTEHVREAIPYPRMIHRLRP